MRGYDCIRQPNKLRHVLDQLDLYSSTVHPSQQAGGAELLALHALATGDEVSLHSAYEAGAALTFRPRTWIPVEVLLEHLGRPLPLVQTQWLEPYPVVRDRWLAIMRDIISRSERPRAFTRVT